MYEAQPRCFPSKCGKFMLMLGPPGMISAAGRALLGNRLRKIDGGYSIHPLLNEELQMNLGTGHNPHDACELLSPDFLQVGPFNFELLDRGHGTGPEISVTLDTRHPACPIGITELKFGVMIETAINLSDEDAELLGARLQKIGNDHIIRPLPNEAFRMNEAAARKLEEVNFAKIGPRVLSICTDPWTIQVMAGDYDKRGVLPKWLKHAAPPPVDYGDPFNRATSDPRHAGDIDSSNHIN